MAELEAKQTETGNSGALLILCGVGLFAILSSTMSKTPVLPLFAKDYLHVGDAVLGFIAAASTVVGIIVSLPAGALSDILGRRVVLLSAMFVFATAPLLYLLVHSAAALVAVRLYHGLATAIFGPVAMAYVADLARQRRAERMGWYSSATLVGRLVAPMLGGVLILVSYHTVYLGCAVAGLVALGCARGVPKLISTGRRAKIVPRHGLPAMLLTSPCALRILPACSGISCSSCSPPPRP